MTPISRPSTVPRDMWICGKCGGDNLIALANEKCPVCAHSKCSTCTTADQTYPEKPTCNFVYQSGYLYLDPFPAFPYPSSAPSVQYGLNSDMPSYRFAAMESFAEPSFPSFLINPQDVFICAGAGSPASGAWTCGACGAGNGDATPDWCPACGASR